MNQIKITCINCKNCKKSRLTYLCIAEQDKVKLPIQNFITDCTDCYTFENKEGV